MLNDEIHWVGAHTVLAEIDDGTVVIKGPLDRIRALQYLIDARERGKNVVALSNQPDINVPALLDLLGIPDY